MSKRREKKKKRGGIVPRTVFAVSVACASVPTAIACGSSEHAYGVAAPPGVAATSGGESVDAGVTEIRYDVDAGPPPPPSVAALPPGVAARPDYYGVAAPRH